MDKVFGGDLTFLLPCILPTLRPILTLRPGGSCRLSHPWLLGKDSELAWLRRCHNSSSTLINWGHKTHEPANHSHRVTPIRLLLKSLGKSPYSSCKLGSSVFWKLHQRMKHTETEREERKLKQEDFNFKPSSNS